MRPAALATSGSLRPALPHITDVPECAPGVTHDDMLSFHAGKGLEVDALPGDDGRTCRAHETRPCQLYSASCGAAIAR